MNRFDHAAWNAPLSEYETQAAMLLQAYRAGHAGAMELFHNNLPRFLDDKVKWLPRDLEPNEIERAALSLDDARLAVARVYSFRDWEALISLVNAVADCTSAVHEFERAVEAVITGDVMTLQAMLKSNPQLVHARSTRATCHDPSVHAATLLHYIAANGVEGYRQKSPANAEAIARLLLTSGAQADALAGMYGGECPTLSMLASSTPPAECGVQVPIINALVDFGASPEGAGHGAWRSPLLTALVFGFKEAAEALVLRGALIDDVTKASGLGRVDTVRELLPGSTVHQRHAALALAAIGGHEAVVKLLVEGNEDPNRMNPDGFHSHSTQLHQAACAGHLGTVKTLVSLGARTDIADTLWHSDALGWAEHCEQPQVAAYLRTVTVRAP